MASNSCIRSEKLWRVTRRQLWAAISKGAGLPRHPGMAAKMGWADVDWM